MQPVRRKVLERPRPADRLGSIRQVRLSRHARNEMRLYGISMQDLQAVITAPVVREVDERGNACLIAEASDGPPYP